MNPKFVYRHNGSPSIVLDNRESEPVSYQGMASITDKVNHNVYIAVGDYYDGHTPMKPGHVYRIIEVIQTKK